MAGLQCWASKTLSGVTLTVLDSTSTLPIISLMKDHFAEILRVEGHRCLHSSHLYIRGKVTLGGNLGNVKSLRYLLSDQPLRTTHLENFYELKK